MILQLFSPLQNQPFLQLLQPSGHPVSMLTCIDTNGYDLLSGKVEDSPGFDILLNNNKLSTMFMGVK